MKKILETIENLENYTTEQIDELITMYPEQELLIIELYMANYKVMYDFLEKRKKRLLKKKDNNKYLFVSRNDLKEI